MKNKPTIPPQYSLQQLQEYLLLSNLFTGGGIKEALVSRDVIIWFKAQRQQIAKNFNIAPGATNTDVEFMGVKLIDKDGKENEGLTSEKKGA